MNQVIAQVLYEQNQVVRVEISQAALLELAAGKALEFAGVRITAVDTAPAHGHYMRPVKMFDETD